mgnify:FL=1
MNRIILMILIVLLGGNFVAFAQQNKQSSFDEAIKSLIKSRKENAFIIDALKPELCIIRQQYQLKRGEDMYGSDGKSYYGETYTLGVKVPGYLYMQRGVLKPWEGDKNYDRVNADGKYESVYFKSFQRSLVENKVAYSPIEIEFGRSYLQAINSDQTLYRQEDLVSDFGLSIDEAGGVKRGIMVWVYSNSTLKDSAMTVSFQQEMLSLEAKSDSILIPQTVSNADRLLGGVFVVPSYERGGRIQIRLAGIAVRTANGDWNLQLLASHFDDVSATDTKDTSNRVDAEEEKSKDFPEGNEPTLIK